MSNLGGFKLWECSLDLVDWLAAGESVSGLRVLELGCAVTAFFFFLR